MGRLWLLVGLGSLALLGCGGSPSDANPLGAMGGDGGIDGTLGSGPDGAVGGDTDATAGGDTDSAAGPGADGGDARADGSGVPADGGSSQGDGASASGDGSNAPPDATADAPLGNPGDGAVDQASPPTDASQADGASPDGSGPAPGHILCGTADCTEATQFCCVALDGGASCVQSGASCVGGARRSCEKTSDCSNGEVCCFDFSTAPASASCRGDCNGGGGTRLQACRTQADCTSGTCATHSCTVGGPIESCAGFPSECP